MTLTVHGVAFDWQKRGDLGHCERCNRWTTGKLQRRLEVAGTSEVACCKPCAPIVAEITARESRPFYDDGVGHEVEEA